MPDENQPLKGLAALMQAYGQQPTVQSLAAIQPHVIDRRVYKNNTINIDGYTFSNCAFIGCDLTTSKGNFRLKGCHFQNCRFFFSDNALRAVKLSSVLIDSWDHLPAGLRAEVEPDWGVTVE